MSLNSKICKVIHFGKKNPEKDYFIGYGNKRVALGKTEAEKDLGFIIENNGKSSKQKQSAVSRANSVLGRMRKTFQFFNIRLFKIIYPTYIRPHLEFGSAVWNSMNNSHKKIAHTKKSRRLRKGLPKWLLNRAQWNTRRD